jgi:hypothetical protein
MAALVFVAEKWKDRPVNSSERTLCLDDDGYYWHLYRYFEGANLDRRRELVDLYGAAEIDGYQLERLAQELRAARRDAARNPARWRVLTGWRNTPARENEIWSPVERTKLIELIDQLLWLVAFARKRRLKLIVSGD